ncbi:MAG: glutamate-5-semialdehyde dehydrogenase [Lachnospirales bacterium]
MNIYEKASLAKKDIIKLTTDEKNSILIKISHKILENKDKILFANKKDLENARINNLKDSFVKRLVLDEEKIDGLSQSLVDVANLPDVIGDFDSNRTLNNGLVVGKKRVPLGVIGVIYESRPNVTVDVFALCFKSSNVSILKGGKEAICSNIILHGIIEEVLVNEGYNKNFCQLIKETSREATMELMSQKDYVDLLIPRGSQGLINAVSDNSKIPVIETGVGNCHLYVDESCNEEKAIEIIINGKTQRPDVCNALETVLVNEKIHNSFLQKLQLEFNEHNTKIYGCHKTMKVINCQLATEEDYKKEYLDNIVAIKVVEDVDEAIEHISKYSTNHSEVIVSENYSNIEKFLNEVDSAVVYANASSRFTDGGEFGFGSEIGISTQKLHARGPMGLREITTTKYVVYGKGQVRG